MIGITLKGCKVTNPSAQFALASLLALENKVTVYTPRVGYIRQLDASGRLST
jgi:hypothetical protein